MKSWRSVFWILPTAILSLGVGACEGPPEIHPMMVDAKRDRFLVQELVKEDGLVFRNVEWQYGLENLNGAACIEGAEYAKLMSYLRRVQKAQKK